jgi:hypothetical protein
MSQLQRPSVNVTEPDRILNLQQWMLPCRYEVLFSQRTAAVLGAQCSGLNVVYY